MNEARAETRHDLEKVDRPSWQKPEVRRLVAGQAEGAAGVGADAAIFS